MATPGLCVPDLGARVREAEIMDEPGLERDRHLEALRALARVNHASLAADRVWREVARIHARKRRTVRVLDVACGGGDVLAGLVRRARRARVPVEVSGCDTSRVALETARARVADLAAACWLELDAVRGRLPSGHDLVCSSLFLHHLSEAEAEGLLLAMSTAAEASILVQDLRRTRLGYLLAWAGLHVLTRSDVARRDGLTSVRAAFTLAEAKALSARAGLSGARIEACWPQRFTIRWSRS